MKIVQYDVKEVSFPLRTPFVTALRRVDRVQAFHLFLRDETGLCGAGAASPVAAVTGETPGAIRDGIACLGESLLAAGDAGLKDLLEIVSGRNCSLKGNPGAKAAMDAALYDLYSRGLGIPIYTLLGGTARRIESDLTISLGDPAEMEEDARRAEERGFRTLKIKLGRDGETDFERFARLSSAVSCTLRIDANQGWSVKETLRFMDRCDRSNLPVDLLEQPVRAGDLAGMAEIRRRIPCPLAADESVFSPEDALRLLECGGADIINIKLLKCGGLYQASRIAHLAETAGAACMIGCMMESPAGISAALHFAAAFPVVTYFDLDLPFLLERVPEEYGMVCSGIHMAPADQAGLIRDGTEPS